MRKPNATRVLLRQWEPDGETLIVLVPDQPKAITRHLEAIDGDLGEVYATLEAVCMETSPARGEVLKKLRREARRRARGPIEEIGTAGLLQLVAK